MGFLSPSDFSDIKGAIKQVTDTFSTVPVTIVTRTDKFSAFNQSRDDTSNQVETVVLGLIVYNTSDKGKIDKVEAGGYNFKEGYILFNFQDLDSAGLIGGAPDYLPTFKEHTDNLKFQGIECEIEGIDPAGPLENKYAVVKVQFKLRTHGKNG